MLGTQTTKMSFAQVFTSINLIFNLCQLLEHFITKNQQIPAKRIVGQT